MKKTRVFFWVVVSVLIAMLTVACAAPTAPKATTTPAATTTTQEATVLKWNLQSVKGPGSAAWDKSLPLFADNVKKMSNGRIIITLLPPAAIVPSTDAFAAVGKGTIDMALDAAVYHAGVMPIGDLVCFSPFVWTEKWQRDYFHWQLGAMDVAREAYGKNNVYLIGASPAVLYGSIISKKPIKSLEDLKGLKIRTFGTFGKVIQKLGASIVSVAGEEIYTGLATGTFDGGMFGGPSDFMPLRLHEVAKNYTMPAWDAATTHEIHMNINKWNALPADLKAIIQVAFDSFNINYQAEQQKMDSLIIKEWQTKWGVSINELSEADMAKLRVMVLDVLDEQAKLDPYNARWIKIQKDFMIQLGLAK